MTEEELNRDHVVIDCEICLSVVPKEQSEYAEVDDYVVYFCGLECYQQWKQGQSNNNS